MRAELGAAAYLAVIPGLRTGMGFDVMGALWLGRRLGGGVRVGVSRGAREDSVNGAIAALLALQASLGLRSWVDLGHVRVLVGVAGQYALVPAVGTDQTLPGRKIEVTGVKGVGFEASAAAAWPF